MDFDYYHSHGGSLCEAEFNIYNYQLELWLKSYCESFIFKYQLKDDFEAYGIDINKALCIEIDFISRNGGTSALDGVSDFDVKSVSTSGYTYSGDAKIDTFEGIPIAPMAKTLIKDQMRRLGYLQRCVL